MSTPLEQVALLLRDVAEAVASLESQAALALEGQQDEAGYRKLMLQKAELLAGLAAQSAPAVEALPPARREMVAATLGSFSKNAATAIKLGSVFYMSALLYPDDHQPGQPNNLEFFIRSLDQA
jgi:hypothetical protein